VDQPRIIHIDSGRSWRGGQRQVFLLATGLRDLGYRTLVVAPTGSPLIRRAEQAGLPPGRVDGAEPAEAHLEADEADEQREELGERLEQGAAALESPTDYLNMD